MPLVTPDEGLPILLALLLKDAAMPGTAWKLTIFVNNLTPTQATVFADMTVATFTGFSEVTIARGTWVSPTVSSHKGVTTYGSTPTQWTLTATPQTVYGYAIYDPATSKILWIERFASSVALIVGSIIGVLPRVTLTTEP